LHDQPILGRILRLAESHHSEWQEGLYGTNEFGCWVN
jgi:hypothetical protein